MKWIFSLAMLCLIISVQHLMSQPSKRFIQKYVLPAAPAEKKPVIKTIELSANVKLEYAEQGSPVGLPVIMLHGFTDSWHSYEMALSHLPASLHVYSISQRGHGNSSKSEQGYDPEDFAGDIAAFMQKQKLKQAVIVGHSMGSTMAQCFALKYPGLVKALVLVGAFSDFKKPAIADFKKVIDELTDPVDSLFIAEFQKSTIVRPIPPDMLEQFIRESQKVPAHVWKGVAAGWEKSDFVNALTQFNKPTLLLWGDRDAFCPRTDQDQLHHALKNSRLVVYNGTGHALHWEEPGRFANDLAEFINKNEPEP